jgi:hypothetical protein
MKKDTTILNELRELSPVVASVGNACPYQVPQGYFEELPVQLMLKIAVQEKAGEDPTVNFSKDNVYDVPQGYFDSLAGNIMNRIRSEEAAAKADEPDFSSPVWKMLSKETPYQVPAGYFTDSADNIVAGAKAIAFVNDELENLSPLMSSLRHKEVYQIPAGYFNQFAGTVLAKLQEKQGGKVVSMGFTRKMFRYAAAAVITAVVATGAWMFVKPGSTVTPVSPATENITRTDIPELKNISDDEILNFANDVPAVADTSILVSGEGEMTNKDAKDLLANISDEELQHYAEQHLETPITN